MSLLISESPLQISPSLANRIGLNEAIVLQQMHCLVAQSNNILNGKKWVCISVEEWQKQFPFWSVGSLRRTIISLRKLGLVVAENFNQTAMDRTWSYTIDYGHVMIRSTEGV